MEVVHDSIFGGHLGIKKTKDRIQTNFYWPAFQLYLAGKPFFLQSDHQPLACINKTKYQNDRIMRWALTL